MLMVNFFFFPLVSFSFHFISGIWRVRNQFPASLSYQFSSLAKLTVGQESKKAAAAAAAATNCFW